MNWLRNFVPPRLRGLVGGAQKHATDELWRTCPKCAGMIFHRDLRTNLGVCSHCDHHLRLDVEQRLEMLFDDGEYTAVEMDQPEQDPLRFRDRRKYADRLREAHAESGRDDALVASYGRMGGIGVVAAAQDFRFMSGTMGVAAGEAFVRAARLAVVQGAPLIVITASAGARLQEGSLALMQMARATLAIEEVKNADLPVITVLTDPTVGTATGSFAMLGDITIAEPGAAVALGPEAPLDAVEGGQRAEAMLERGMIDMIVHRHKLRDALVRIVSLLSNPGPAAIVLPLPHVELLSAMKEDALKTSKNRPDKEPTPD